MKRKGKISSTAYRVLLLLLLLNEDDFNIDELIRIFSKDPQISRTFTNEVILKYINTLKAAGFELARYNSSNDNKYTIVKSPFLIDLSKEDVTTILMMESYISTIYQEKLKKTYGKIVSRVSKYLSDDMIDIMLNQRQILGEQKCFDDEKYLKYEHLIKDYERYCIEDQQVVVVYKLPPENKTVQITLEPKFVKYAPGRVYICGYNPYAQEKQLILVDYITEVRQLPQKSKHNAVLPTVVFKMFGRLAKGYKLREEEKLMPSKDIRPDSLTISSSYDDKKLLFSRLLRYGAYCEILYPLSIRKEFIELIDKSLANYES